MASVTDFAYCCLWRLHSLLTRGEFLPCWSVRENRSSASTGRSDTSSSSHSPGSSTCCSTTDVSDYSTLSSLLMLYHWAVPAPPPTMSRLLDLLWWLLRLPLPLHRFASSALWSVPCQRSLAPGGDYPSSKEMGHLCLAVHHTGGCQIRQLPTLVLSIDFKSCEHNWLSERLPSFPAVKAGIPTVEFESLMVRVWTGRIEMPRFVLRVCRTDRLYCLVKLIEIA